MWIDSPAPTLVREQYPSIHGQRYLLLDSIRVLLSSQSRVPALAFSRPTRPLWPKMDLFVTLPESFSTWAQLDSAATAPRPIAPLSRSRRVMALPAAVGLSESVWSFRGVRMVIQFRRSRGSISPPIHSRHRRNR